MLAYFDTTLGWREIFTRTLRETHADNGTGLAAQLAYYFFLSLFPALLFLLALASFLPAEDLIHRVVTALDGVAPEQAIEIIRSQLAELAAGRQGGLLSFGVIAALWSSSAAMVAIIDVLNRAYDIEEQRPWWKQRITAVLLTVGVAVLMLVAFTLIVAGPQIAEFVSNRIGLSTAVEWTWKIAQWPLAFALVASAIGLIYYFAPDVEQDFAWITAGSLVATVLWGLGSFAFRLYVTNFGSYNETYGTIGGVMVLMLWLYLTGLVIIVGAEMNAEIEHASEHGKNPGQKVPGQRKVVGARAAKAFRERVARQPRVTQPQTRPAQR